MAILEFVTIWVVISVVVGVLLGFAIYRMSKDAPIPNIRRSRSVRPLRRLHFGAGLR